MSGFVDFVVADTADKKKLLKHDRPTEKWPGFEWKWVDDIQLAFLYGVLRESKDRYALQSKLKTEYQRSGQAVTELPTEMIETLAALDKKKREQVAREWRKCEEFFDKDDQKAALELVTELSELAAKAKAAGKPVLVRQSGAY